MSKKIMGIQHPGFPILIMVILTVSQLSNGQHIRRSTSDERLKGESFSRFSQHFSAEASMESGNKVDPAYGVSHRTVPLAMQASNTRGKNPFISNLSVLYVLFGISKENLECLDYSDHVAFPQDLLSGPGPSTTAWHSRIEMTKLEEICNHISQ